VSTELVALGLLSEGPLHGYDLRRRFEERGLPAYTRLSFGALYHALGRLEEKELVTRRGAERAGRRPERVVFEITAAGRAELRRLALEALQSIERLIHPVDEALAFSVRLAADEVAAALNERLARQREVVRDLEARAPEIVAQIRRASARAADPARVMRVGPSMLEHALAHERAELAWLEALCERIAAPQAPQRGGRRRCGTRSRRESRSPRPQAAPSLTSDR